MVGKFQDASNPSISGSEYSTVALTTEWRLEHGSRPIDLKKKLCIAPTYFGGVHQCWLSDSELLRPAVIVSCPSPILCSNLL